MKNICSKWKDLLLEAALTDSTGSELQKHLSECAGCVQELARLQAQRQRMDAALPLLAGRQEPAPDFAARVMAATEAQHAQRNLHGRRWLFAVATAIVAVLVTAVILHRPAISGPSKAELATAEKLAQWRAPSDALLAIPGQEMLQKIPNLSESYLKLDVRTSEIKEQQP
ncbi:MAG TPA: hypothetical protein VHA33_17540 [Candidatus Angelobacter sp.]|jgi:hypothetical protein|nr:hypothetical protein [Candidatus Angelobacter sp.]